MTRVAFELDASCSFINASCDINLGLEVEAFREMMGNSSQGSRERVGQMCRDREVLELGEVTYARGWMRMCMEFRNEILFLRGENVKPRENLIFSTKKWAKS